MPFLTFGMLNNQNFMEHIETFEQSQKAILNIASNSENPTEAILSNLTYAPFILDDIEYASVEAFWQGLKFADNAKRLEIASMHGIESKKIGNNAPKNETFECRGEVYRVGSVEHQGLMERAIRAKFEQNPMALKLLLETGNTDIIHRPIKKDGTPYPDSTSIPEKIFSDFLMELREEFRLHLKVE